MYTSSEGTGESAHMRRLARAFAAGQCDTCQNIMCWVILSFGATVPKSNDILILMKNMGYANVPSLVHQAIYVHIKLVYITTTEEDAMAQW